MSGRATHKRSGAHIDITTSLPAQRLAELCSEATEGTRARIDRVEHGRLAFSVRGRPDKITLMQFKVESAEGDSEPNVLTSEITMFKTQQQTFMGFIPDGPKHLHGIVSYDTFMKNLAERVKREDPASDITIAG